MHTTLGRALLQHFLASHEVRPATVADEAGLRRMQISHATSGRRIPSLRVAVALEEYTKGEVPAHSWLLEETDVSRRRYFTYDDATNAILDALLKRGVTIGRYIDALVQEAQQSWEDAAREAYEAGWTVEEVCCAMDALAGSDGLGSVTEIIEVMRRYEPSVRHKVTPERWREVIDQISARNDVHLLRALLILSRAQRRGLGPAIKAGYGRG